MSSLESVDCIFQFFGEGQQFAVVEEYTCNILTFLILTVLLIFRLSKIVFNESIYCKNFSAVDVLFRV